MLVTTTFMAIDVFHLQRPIPQWSMFPTHSQWWYQRQRQHVRQESDSHPLPAMGTSSNRYAVQRYIHSKSSHTRASQHPALQQQNEELVQKNITRHDIICFFLHLYYISAQYRLCLLHINHIENTSNESVTPLRRSLKNICE